MERLLELTDTAGGRFVFCQDLHKNRKNYVSLSVIYPE